MQDFAQFHQNLLGIDPDKTPANFRLSPIHQRLYDEAQKGRHGGLLPHQGSLENWDHFLATFIVAYSQTNQGQVFFAVSASTHKWAINQVNAVARHIFATRKKTPKPTLVRLYQGLQALSMGSNVLRIAEPPRWVVYGFHEKDVLPPWMRGKLAVAATKPKPDVVSDEKRAV